MSKDILLETVRGILPDKYQNIHPLTEGKAGKLFLSEWGPGKELRVIKIDKIPEGKRSQRNFKRGYNTRNEVRALSQIRNPEKHFLMKLLDYYETEEHTLLVEPYFEGSESLENIAGRLSAKEVGEVFSQVFEGVRYLMREGGMFHRDLKPDNILVRKDKNGIEVRVADLANAGRKENMAPKPEPTAGGHLVTDPLVGEEKAYDENSEMYSLGASLFFGLAKRHIFNYHPEEGIAEVISTGENLIGRDGKIDTRKHEQALDTALAALPRPARKYAGIIKRCMTLDEAKRYSSIDNLIADFKKANKPSFWEKPMLYMHPAVYAAAALLVIIAGIGGTLEVNRHKNKVKELETAVQEPNKYEIVSGWDGYSLEATCNLLDLDMVIFSNNPYEMIYGNNRGEQIRPQFLELSRGDKLSIIPSPKEKPRPTKGAALPFIKGKLYFEGWPGIEFHTDSWIVDASQYDMFGPMFRDIDVIVPEDMPDGNYALVLELYAHDRPDPKNTITALSEIRYRHPGRMMCRKRIPVVVGNPKDTVNTSILRLGYADYISICTLGGDLRCIDKSLSYELSIPEMGFRKKYENKGGPSNAFSAFGGLPSPKDERDVTLQIAVLDGNTLVGYSAFPIKGDPIGNNPRIWWWTFAMNGPDFAENIVKYRQELQQRLAEQESTVQKSKNQAR